MNLALMIKRQGFQRTYWYPAYISDDGQATEQELLSSMQGYFHDEIERKVISTPHTNEYVELRPC